MSTTSNNSVLSLQYLTKDMTITNGIKYILEAASEPRIAVGSCVSNLSYADRDSHILTNELEMLNDPSISDDYKISYLREAFIPCG